MEVQQSIFESELTESKDLARLVDDGLILWPYWPPIGVEYLSKRTLPDDAGAGVLSVAPNSAVVRPLTFIILDVYFIFLYCREASSKRRWTSPAKRRPTFVVDRTLSERPAIQLRDGLGDLSDTYILQRALNSRTFVIILSDMIPFVINHFSADDHIVMIVSLNLDIEFITSVLNHVTKDVWISVN